MERLMVRRLSGRAAALQEELAQWGLAGEEERLRPVVLSLQLPADEAKVLRSRSAEFGVEVASAGRALVVSGSTAAVRRLAEALADRPPDVQRAMEAALRCNTPRRLLARGRELELGSRTLVMGILNLSPDSFSGDGTPDTAEAVNQGLELISAGADILDVGAMSTRPGSQPIPKREEATRLATVIGRLRQATRAVISADTYRPGPARAALEAGAEIINDVSGLRDPAMVELAAESGAGVVIMHMLGTPATMQVEPRYGDVVAEVYEYLAQAAERAVSAGIARESIVVDPGIGFGKTVAHNLQLLRRLEALGALGYPVLVGTSRKSFIGRLTGRDVSRRIEGTAATVAVGIANGADIVRVHDVAEMLPVVKVTDAVVRPAHAAATVRP